MEDLIKLLKESAITEMARVNKCLESEVELVLASGNEIATTQFLKLMSIGLKEASCQK